jgi:hypothetical protein
LGGDGGRGGIIDLVIEDVQANLLMAFDYDVSGGSGGSPGTHGIAGKGGIKGRGGKQYEWQVTQANY